MVGSFGAGLLLANEGAHLPSVNDFLPPEILFQGTPFAINRIILIRIVATIVLLLVLGITAKHAKLIPGRWQGAAVLANAINTRSNWIGEKTSDMPRIGVSVTETSTIIRFMECRGAGRIALPLADGERLASWLYDMADGCWRAHCGYVPEVVK